MVSPEKAGEIGEGGCAVMSYYNPDACKGKGGEQVAASLFDTTYGNCKLQISWFE
jgi:hypothetical protein